MTSWWKEKKPDYNQIFSALTLTTPELTSERQKIDEEEKRKEHLHKKLLSNLLPWQTSEEESKILEEECKDAILTLSKKDETFVSSIAPEEQDTMPPLLVDFDLDLHYSMIQRLLTVDPNLVEMQAHLSGAGSQENKFWKNYFQHCAVIRKQVGMSVTEIWRDTDQTSADSVSTAKSGEHENEIVFSRSSSNSSETAAADNTTSSNNKQQTPSEEKQNPAFFNVGIPTNVTTTFAASASKLVGGLFSATPAEGDGQAQEDKREGDELTDSFEIIKDKRSVSYSDKNESGEDDLDDLEAEIAKELES